MKKLFALFLAFALLGSAFTGCNGTSDQPDTTQPPATPSATQPPVEADKPFALDKTVAVFSALDETQTLLSDKDKLPDVTWKLDREGIIEITDGVAKAVDSGTVNITATWKEETAVCTVLCMFPSVESGTPDFQPTDKRAPVLAVPIRETVEASFFDDAVFVGDSVSLMLSYYANSSGRLGKAKFLVQGSYGAGNAVSNQLQMSYQGQKMNLESAVAATGAKKLFIMLGMNDIALYGVDKTIQNWDTMLGRIKAKCPDIKIYIQSMTPIWTGGERGALSNDRADQFNLRLKAFAQENGHTFIDVAPYLKDSTGGLATAYCSDQYVHITNAGAAAWVSVLRAFDGY